MRARSFRFLSPVLLLDEGTRTVEKILSVALTNRPALLLSAIENFSIAISAQMRRPRLSEIEEARGRTVRKLIADGMNPLLVAEAMAEIYGRETARRER